MSEAARSGSTGDVPGGAAAGLFGAAERAALAQALAPGAADGPRGDLRFDEPMSRHTTLRIGGPVDAWVAPGTVAAVQQIRALCTQKKWPCRAVGAGSNLLVLDGGIRGVVISSERLRALAFLDDRDGAQRVEGADVTRVVVGAGVPTGKLLSETIRRGLGGLEFLGGVPGSVGGGLMMNAGTYLGEFRHVTARVRSVDAFGALRERDHDACGFVYRGSALPPEEMVVEGELRLRPRPRGAIEADVRALRQRRREREPRGVANAGSIFKNPPGDHAGRLIEACGLKGRRIGDAEVAQAHANWIVNDGAARAADFLALVESVREAVRARFGVLLELELRIVGDP